VEVGKDVGIDVLSDTLVRPVRFYRGNRPPGERTMNGRDNWWGLLCAEGDADRQSVWKVSS
jgi:hypothetical protein